MTYIDQRDAILVHAKAAALATDSKWTNVAIGAPVMGNSKGCRVYYGGESAPARMGESPRVLNGEMVSSHVALVAWWPLAGLADNAVAAVDTQMFTFVHELRTRILGDSQLGGKSTDLLMAYAEPDWLIVGGTRYALVGADFTCDYTEYTLAP